MNARIIAAIAAAQAVVLGTAANAAADIPFGIQPSLSYATFSVTLDLSQVGAGVHVATPQYPDPDGPGFVLGSDTVHLYGLVQADWPGFGTFELLEASVGWQANNTPGGGGVPGAFSPHDPVVTDPVGVPGGTTFGANYGLMIDFLPDFAYYQVLHGLHGHWVTTNPGPRPWNGATGEFSYVPGDDFIIADGGRSAFTTTDSLGGTVLGTDTRSVVGEPLVAFGTTGLAAPKWEPLNITAGFQGTLTLPIESYYVTAIDLSHLYPGAMAYLTMEMSGQIVATPVPEPTGTLLLAMGIAGLWLARRAPGKPGK